MEDALLDRRPTALATPVRSYRVRWWLLFLATLVAGSQGGIWLLYGVIAEAVEPLYGWDDGTIALLALWGPVGYLIAACPTAWLLDTCGPREACVAGATLVFAGSAARAARFATDSTGSVLAHIGQCLNALAGPVAMSIGPVLSAVWFPASERNAATAIAASANYGGTAVVFWLGSVCVPAGAPADVTRCCLWRLMLGFAVFSGLIGPPPLPAHLQGASRLGALALTRFARSRCRRDFAPIWLKTDTEAGFSLKLNRWDLSPTRPDLS